jgi:hypothetical protein
LAKVLEPEDLRKLCYEICNDSTKANMNDPANEIESSIKDWNHWSGVLIDQDFWQ